MPTELTQFSVNYEMIGKRVVEIIDRVGFAVLPKGDWDAEMLGILLDCVPELADADSFERSEILGITDQRFRAIYGKISMRRVQRGRPEDDLSLIASYLEKALELWRDDPETAEVRLVVDDEAKRRSLMRALERAGAPVELSITGHSLVMKRAGFDRLLKRLESDNALPQQFVSAMAKRNRRDRIASVAEAMKNMGAELITQIAVQVASGTVG